MLRKVLLQQPFAANDSVLVIDRKSIQARHYLYKDSGINWKLIVAMPADFVGDNGSNKSGVSAFNFSFSLCLDFLFFFFFFKMSALCLLCCRF